MFKYLFIFFLFIAVAGSAQTREDYEQTGRPEFSKAIQIFPNPAVDFVHVRMENFPAANFKLTVHNLIGNQVQVETEVIDEHEIRVRVKDLNAGYYLLALKDDEDRFKGTYKFLKR
jgi:hypothetical protein